ncbi:efflux RND transporter periplasmic adaptor subunit [Achromobacter pestifer]
MSQHSESPRARRAANRRLALATLLGLAAIGGLYLYDAQRKAAIAAQTAAVADPAPVPVVVAPARSQTVPQRLQAIGTVVADQQVLVASEIAGRITAIHFASGQHVTAGMPLVQLNDGPVQRELERHRASAMLARANLARAKRLHGQTMSSAEYEQHVAAYAQSRAQVAQSEEDAAHRLVRAPFTGTLGLRQVNLGQYVEAGTPLATLTDTRVLHVDFTLPDRHRSALLLGLDVSIASSAGAPLAGKLTAIDPQGNAGDRTVQLRATLGADAAGTLWPGAYAPVTVTLPSAPVTITVPAAAVQSSLSGDTVFAVQGSGKDARARLISVQTGARQDGVVALSAAALRDGDLVVIAGQLNIQDGSPVLARHAD